MSVDDLSKASVFDGYDDQLFFDALNEALEKWAKNDHYRRKLNNSGFDKPVENWSDVKQLPTVGMREFKTRPEELALNHLDEKKALYSSGTTTGNKSFAPRSEFDLETHKTNLRGFSEAVIGDVDYAASLGLPRGELSNLPIDLSRRAVFRYILWLMDTHDSEYFMSVNEKGEITANHQHLLDYLKANDGTGVIKGSTSGINNFCQYLDQNGEEVDLGENGIVVTGGGWKGDTGKTRAELREQISELFNIREDHQLDFYSATEFMFFTGPMPGDKNMDKKRVPSQAYVYVADEDAFRRKGIVEPADGNEGLLVAVDPLNTSHPAVILTDDRMEKTGGEYNNDVRIRYLQKSTRS